LERNIISRNEMERGGMTTRSDGAIRGIKVLDLSRVLAGPWASQMLGDLGADVLKIENPRGGDDTRHWGPPFLDAGQSQTADAAYFTACNRNKRSVTIDFSKPEGAEIVRRLAKDADVLIENFKLDGLKKYGLDYASLKAINPAIVYCSITGFGQSGPYARRLGYDYLMQGIGGLMSITGLPDGEPGAGPVKVGVAVSDLFTGMYAAVSILAALTHRANTGEGQYIDCALLDAQVAMLANQSANFLVGGVAPTRMGNRHPNVTPYGVYTASDGDLIIACGNDAQFERLCHVLDAGEIASDPRFRSNRERIAARQDLEECLKPKIAERGRDELVRALEAAGVACGPINDVSEVFADPHVVARGLVVPMARGDGVQVPTIAFPSRLSATPATYRSAPPRLGEHTGEVLSAFLDGAELERLRQAGVIS
jgi:crotonobetainyl-CoA:carnitine CoA-transferase CaiB-like acyl-CoA transferase